MVSAAHCNFICKDQDGNMVEICCCRERHLQESCRNTSSYCGRAPTLVAASSSEMNIVCSEHSLQIQPEDSTDEKEVVLSLAMITNHPNYNPGTPTDKGADLKGPYAGADIAVYHLTAASNMKLKNEMKEGVLWPACLPKKRYTSQRGIFAGWLDQEPYFRTSTNNIKNYVET